MPTELKCRDARERIQRPQGAELRSSHLLRFGMRAELSAYTLGAALLIVELFALFA